MKGHAFTHTQKTAKNLHSTPTEPLPLLVTPFVQILAFSPVSWETEAHVIKSMHMDDSLMAFKPVDCFAENFSLLSDLKDIKHLQASWNKVAGRE